MDCRTRFEKEIHDLLDDLNALLTLEMSVQASLPIRGRLRDARVRLDNKRFGCHSGRHASACHCLREVA